MKRLMVMMLLVYGLAVPAAAELEQGGVIDVFEVLQKERVDPGQPFRSIPLLRGPNCSLALAQLLTAVKSHYHRDRDEVVYLIRGHGLLVMAGNEYKVGPGHAYLVPRGTVHSFVNLGPDAAVVLSVFSPPFDGKDRIFVED